GARSLGVTNAFGRVEGDYQITVVGEVPLDTVKIIGNSFRPK
ncbi:MAG: transcriptional regulator, partial [Gammaproteobacteria bacterium]|nr:transcriptional regulator [Gammaproteobacteria bacterium]